MHHLSQRESSPSYKNRETSRLIDSSQAIICKDCADIFAFSWTQLVEVVMTWDKQDMQRDNWLGF